MRFILTISAALLMSSSAFAADDIMASTYGNTVVGKTAMFESHTHYNADHTFTASYSAMMGSMDAKGTWSIDGTGKLCRQFETAPPGAPNPLCVPWAAHKLGDNWQTKSANSTADVSLVAGIK